MKVLSHFNTLIVNISISEKFALFSESDTHFGFENVVGEYELLLAYKNILYMQIFFVAMRKK